MNLASGNTHPIGIFDSGIGGLSVLKEIHQLLPHESLIYVADSAHAPYGDRSATFIRKRSQVIANFLLDQRVKAIVIACNTATAEVAQLLRNTVGIPVIGLEPAIKPAVKLSKNGIIGVLATQRTIDSARLLGLIGQYASDKKVLAQACPGLVEQVEACQLKTKTTENVLKKYILPLLEQGADTLILGCTHYPFLLPTIQKIIDHEILDHKINILETGKPVAQQLKRILKQENLENLNSNSIDNAGCKSQLSFYNSSAKTRHHSTMLKLWHKLGSNFNPNQKSIKVLPLPALRKT